MSALPSQSRRCGCEHHSHLIASLGGHGYLEAPAGALQAYGVGPVCDRCAVNHCAGHLRHVIDEGETCSR